MVPMGETVIESGDDSKFSRLFNEKKKLIPEPAEDVLKPVSRN